MVEEEEYEVELPEPPPAVRGEEMGLLPGPAPEPRSEMQQAILDSGATPVEGAILPTFKTNEGVVYLASPQDIERAGLMDWMGGRRFSRMRTVSNDEIDRMMNEVGDDPWKWGR